jgi:hypothetical protein
MADAMSLHTLSSLTREQLDFVEDQLSNNEVSSNDELKDDFVSAGLNVEQAKAALAYRDAYRLNMFHVEHTPLTCGDEAMRFDPHRGDYVRRKP